METCRRVCFDKTLTTDQAEAFAKAREIERRIWEKHHHLAGRTSVRVEACNCNWFDSQYTPHYTVTLQIYRRTEE